MIGTGNVALDVARMLALTPEELARRTRRTRRSLRSSPAWIREIVVLGRRGPAQAAWTPAGGGRDGRARRRRLFVDPPAELDAASAAELEAAGRRRKRNLEDLRESRRVTPRQAPRRPARFCVSPVAILGDERVEAIELVRNQLVRRRRARGPHRRSARRSSAGSSSAASATTASRFPGVPFDERRVDPERRAARGARGADPGPLRRRLDQARPDGHDRHEQEGRDRDGRAVARGRTRRASRATEGGDAS